MTRYFEWHSRKAAFNIRKHRVTFQEAITVFDDPLARILDDPTHSGDERREIIVGRSSSRRRLLISFRETEPDRIRIISARATKSETYEYEESP